MTSITPFFSSSKTYEAIRLQPVYGLLNPDRYHLYAHELVFLFSDNFTMATILQLTLCNVQLPWDCCNVPLAHKDVYFFALIHVWECYEPNLTLLKTLGSSILLETNELCTNPQSKSWSKLLFRDIKTTQLCWPSTVKAFKQKGV